MSRADLIATDQRQPIMLETENWKKDNKKLEKRREKKNENASQDVKGTFKCDKHVFWKQKTENWKKENKKKLKSKGEKTAKMSRADLNAIDQRQTIVNALVLSTMLQLTSCFKFYSQIPATWVDD